MSMYLFDDAWEMEEYVMYQAEVRRFEGQYLEARIELRDAEAALRADPRNEELQAKVMDLQEKVIEMGSQGPRLAADHPLEIFLWAPPHG